MKTKIQIIALALVVACAISCQASPPLTNNAPVPVIVPTNPITLYGTNPAVSSPFTALVILKASPFDANWTQFQVIPTTGLGLVKTSPPDIFPAALYTSYLSNSADGGFSPLSPVFTNRPVFDALTHNAALIAAPAGLTGQ